MVPFIQRVEENFFLNTDIHTNMYKEFSRLFHAIPTGHHSIRKSRSSPIRIVNSFINETTYWRVVTPNRTLYFLKHYRYNQYLKLISVTSTVNHGRARYFFAHNNELCMEGNPSRDINHYKYYRVCPETLDILAIDI